MIDSVNGVMTALHREEIEPAPAVAPAIPPANVTFVGDLAQGRGPVAAGKVLPKRVITFPLPEPYQDFSITAWINFPQSVGEDLRSGDIERGRVALMQIVRGHDLVDYDGVPYPPADDPKFWDAIPNDVGGMIVTAINSQVGKPSPTSAAR